jgi:hypothetical protein
MKHLYLRLAVVLTLALAILLTLPAHSAPKKMKMLRHVVCIKFKAGTTPEQIKTVEEAFRALKTKIPHIASLEWGLNNSPEGRNKGFTHCFILGFKSEADRAAYLPHPAHKEFGSILGPVLDDVFVIDFWAEN